ncbi:MAG: hypothetical protein ACOC2F_07825 [Bacteroidota bacterium]
MPECKGCGSWYTGDSNYCLFCQSKLTHCKINEFGYKIEGFSIPVPWCFRDNKRVIFSENGWEGCQYYSKQKLLPEVR